ncbi:MAG TPA: hydroxymethylglutaryl-CoA lyase [Woeseiaceae bacterium]|jgi:hydroxymethylglutaryl-CoA lyase|nr:hydroxymethylglutaryl-CoA lyase [Woeseiaceae bacterium]
MENKQILVSEVGPRDGLQSIDAILPTEIKKKWILAMVDAGIREIEVGSFVPASIIPQLADTAEVVEYAITIPNLTVAALVPNLRGAQNAIESGAHKISIPFSTSETHSIRNVNRTHEQMFNEINKVSEFIKEQDENNTHLEVALATAFGCSIVGDIPEDLVIKSAERIMESGSNEIVLSDTTGYGDPARVKSLIRKLKSAIGDDKITGIHLHNTRGLGLANAFAAIEEGITTIDSSISGIGGCPFAPGASGNIVTEDLVFMLDAMGYETGINLDKLFSIREILAKALPNEPLYGYTVDAGLPVGYKH